MPGPLINPGPGHTGDPVVRFHRASVFETARKYHIPAPLLFAILRQEAGTSPAGRPVKPADGAGPASFGQFTTATGRSLHVKYGDSRSEVDAIGRYLLQLGYKTNEPADSETNRRAIGSYNGGPANPQEDYAAKVLKLMGAYKGADATALGNIGGVVTGAVGDVVGAGVDAATAIPKFVGKLGVIFEANFWLRVGLILAGIIAMAAAVVFIGKDFTPVGAVTKAIGK